MDIDGIKKKTTFILTVNTEHQIKYAPQNALMSCSVITLTISAVITLRVPTLPPWHKTIASNQKAGFTQTANTFTTDTTSTQKNDKTKLKSDSWDVQC